MRCSRVLFCKLPCKRSLVFAGLALLAGTSFGLAANYEFLAAPETDLNRVYRLDRVSGEVGACQYGLREASIGVTLCYPPGEGAGPQTPSEYSLIASRHEREVPDRHAHRQYVDLLRPKRSRGVHTACEMSLAKNRVAALRSFLKGPASA